MANASVVRTTKNTLDFYQTPAWCTNAFLDAHKLDPDSTILEPCVGAGAIAKVLEARGHTVIGSDLREDQSVYGHKGVDALEFDFDVFWDFDTIMTNVPFSIGQNLLERWLSFHDGEVITLHRLSFLETSKRSRWLKDSGYLKKVYVFGDRAMLVDEYDPDILLGLKDPNNDGGSAVPYAWYVFDKESTGKPVELDWIFKP